VDLVAVMAGRTAWFPSVAVTAGQRGPGDGDGRKDITILRRSGDSWSAWTLWQ
jgi:hypothetical protein